MEIDNECLRDILVAVNDAEKGIYFWDNPVLKKYSKERIEECAKLLLAIMKS